MCVRPYMIRFIGVYDCTVILTYISRVIAGVAAVTAVTVLLGK